MSIDSTQIERIAHLARLALDGSETERYRSDLNGILELVARMADADTSQIAPLAHPLEIPARLRADEITEPDQRDKLQALAPDTADGHYLVPRVIE